jgi:hypothetical protein
MNRASWHQGLLFEPRLAASDQAQPLSEGMRVGQVARKGVVRKQFALSVTLYHAV